MQHRQQHLCRLFSDPQVSGSLATVNTELEGVNRRVDVLLEAQRKLYSRQEEATGGAKALQQVRHT